MGKECDTTVLFIVGCEPPDTGEYEFVPSTSAYVSYINISVDHKQQQYAHIIFEYLDLDYTIDVYDDNITFQKLIDAIRDKVKQINYIMEVENGN